ncbi:MAG TPA: DUF1127 domain-containing protein [Stellaceae bacterium]|nr:DUF1127 domain-containing protein [Stellaceae bacterium]
MWTYTTAENGAFAANRASIAARLAMTVAAARRRFAAWGAMAQGRAELSRMSDRDLQDMGISRATAVAEARKPFWRE